MGCATGTVKYSLFWFNALWAILGILFIAFGGLVWGAIPQLYAISLIVLGGSILLISIFGCFGAIRESPRMLWTYVTLLVILLVLISVFICFNARDICTKYTLQNVEDSWKLEQTKAGAMDKIQLTYHCCGRNGHLDYLSIANRTETIPLSCCKDNSCVNPKNIYTEGCLSEVGKAFSDEAMTWKYSEWGLLAFNLILLILAFILAIHYTNRERRFRY